MRTGTTAELWRRQRVWRGVLRLFFACGLAALVGCTAVRSRFITANDPTDPALLSNHPGNRTEGVAYFMPMGKLHIVAIRGENLVTNFGIAEETLDDGGVVRDFVTKTKYITNTYVTNYTPTNYNYVTFPASINYSNSTFVTSPVNSNSPPTSYSNIVSGTNYMAATNYLVTNAVTAKNALTNTNAVVSFTILSNVTSSTSVSNPPFPISTQSVVVASNAPATYFPVMSAYSNYSTTTVTMESPLVTTDYFYTITLSVDYVPDPTRVFILKPKTDWFHDDSVNVTVDNNGLLCTVTTSNTDQTGNAFAALAQGAGEAFELAATGGLSSLASGETSVSENDLGEAPQGALHMTQFLPDRLSANDKRHFRDWTLEIKDALEEQEIAKSNILVQSNALMRIKGTERLQGRQGAEPNSDNVTNSVRNANAKLEEAVNREKEGDKLLRDWLFDHLNAEITNGVPFDLADLRIRGVSLPPNVELLAEEAARHPENKKLVTISKRKILEVVCPGLTPMPVSYVLQTPPQYIDISFNPFREDELRQANAQLGAAGIELQQPRGNDETARGYSLINEHTPPRAGGIYYRPALPFEFSVSDGASNVVSRALLFPNFSPILHLDFEKSGFVTRVTHVTMTNGFISSYGLNKPSPFLAMAGLPTQIISSLTSGVTNILQFKLNFANGQSALASSQSSANLASQAALLQSMSNTMAILNAQQQLYAALAAAKTNAQATAGASGHSARFSKAQGQ